jgi:tRNA(Ile2) C34 agmatinyltransferase TiaS
MSKELENYKTLCCKAKYYRKGRANYRCKKCDKDVTLELVLLYQVLETVEVKKLNN